MEIFSKKNELEKAQEAVREIFKGENTGNPLTNLEKINILRKVSRKKLQLVVLNKSFKGNDQRLIEEVFEEVKNNNRDFIQRVILFFSIVSFASTIGLFLSK